MSVFVKNYNNIANNNNNIININNNNNINNSPIRRGDMMNTIQHNGNNNINNNINNVNNNNININNNTNNDSNIIGNSDALGHYLWQCGMWTSCTQEARYLEGSLYFQPQLAIIEPKTLQNVNILSYKSPNNNNNNNNIPNVAPTHSFDDLASLQSGISFNNNNKNNYGFNNIRNNIGNIHNIHNLNNNHNNRNNNNNNKNIRKLGSFKDYVFFSNHRTSKFQRRLGSYGQNIEFQSIYQFEARYFQYSILRGNVRFVKNYTLNTEYLVFKFGRSAQYISRNYNNNNKNNNNNDISIEYGSLYGICELNDRHPERQPWCCQDILSKNELLRHFGLQNCSLSVQNGFLRFIDIDDNCVRKEFDSSMDYNPNVKKITRMLKHGYYDYIKGLERRNFNNLSNNYSNNCDNSSSDDSVHSVVSCPPKYCGNNSRFYGKKSGLNNNNNKYCRNSNGARGARGRKNSRRNRARNARNGSRVVKLKNEDKFSYLKSIADNMGVSWNEFLLRLGWSIIDAFEFARLHSNTVLTQAYIDEENGTMSFELVLFAEIYDEINKKYYKFAVPIVEQQNKETKQWYYIAKNILTPKMAIDNIRLNSLHGQLPKHPWIESIYEDNRSYFRQFNGVWYETRDSRDMTKYYAWINSVISDNKRNNGNNNGYNSNNSKDKPQMGGLDGEISRILGSMLGGGNNNSGIANKLGFVLGFDLMESDNDSCFASKESSVVSVSDCGGGYGDDYCGDSINGIESIANSNEMENDEKIQIINTNVTTINKHTQQQQIQQQQQTGLISGARARRGSVTIGTIDKIDTINIATCTRGRGRRSSVKINIDAPPVDTECKTNENNNNNNSIINNKSDKISKNNKNSKNSKQKQGRSSLNVSATEFFRSLTPDHFDSSLSDSEYNNNSNPLAPSLATLKLGDIVRFGSF